MDSVQGFSLIVHADMLQDHTSIINEFFFFDQAYEY